MPLDEARAKAGLEWLGRIDQNPKAKDKFYEAMKEVDPTVSIPEYDITREIQKIKEQTKEEVSTLKKELNEEKWKNYEDAWKRNLKEEGYSDDEIAKIEEIRKDTNKKYDLAKKVYDADRPLAEPTSSLRGYSDDEPLIPKLTPEAMKDPENYFLNLAHKLTDENIKNRSKGRNR